MLQKDISITTTNNIHTLESDWLRLDEQAAVAISKGDIQYMDYTFYQTYTWYNFLYDTHNHFFTHIEYLAASVEGEVKMILPLKIDSFNKHVRVITGSIAGICNVVCPFRNNLTKELIQAVLNYLKENYNGKWKHLFRDIPLRSLLVDVLTENGEEGVEKCSYHIPVEKFESYEKYLSSLGKNIYKNIRKAYNHLTTDGKILSLQCYTADNPPSRRLLRQLWNIYFQRYLSWKKKNNNVISRHLCRLKAFKQTFNGRQTKSIFRLKESELYVLTIDNKIAAFMHTYVHDGHVLMPKLAIDTSFSRYSPGILLIQETMKQYIQRGIIDFDMCRGNERYKSEVGGINEPLMGFIVTA